MKSVFYDISAGFVPISLRELPTPGKSKKPKFCETDLQQTTYENNIDFFVLLFLGGALPGWIFFRLPYILSHHRKGCV